MNAKTRIGKYMVRKIADLALKINDLSSELFLWAHLDSDEDVEQAWETPVQFIGSRARAELATPPDRCGIYCKNCGWRGTLDMVDVIECPDCWEDLYLDPEFIRAPLPLAVVNPQPAEAH